MNFKNWFDSNLIVCGFPFPKDFETSGSSASNVKTVINLSDEFTPGYAEILLEHKKIYYWLPRGEKGKGLCLENIVAACWILLPAYDNNEKTMVHCMAGKNRSVTVMDCMYFMITGNHRPDHHKAEYRSFTNNRLLENCRQGFLPGIAKMEKLLKELHLRHKEMGRLGDFFDNLNQYL